MTILNSNLKNHNYYRLNFLVSFPEKAAFIVGNEVNGISDKLLEIAHDKIFIPVPGVISSLNVSHSLAVAVFEWLRQVAFSENQ